MTFSSLVPVKFSVDQVAIALSHSSFGGGHLGVAFHDKDKTPRLLHLAWHTDLRLEAIPDQVQQCWINQILDLPPAASKGVVAFVRAVAKRMPTIKYGINALAARNSFVTPGYSPPKGSDGLTCASFVAEVLRGAKVPLVKIESWEESDKNRHWGEAVCLALQRTGVDQGHVNLVRKKY